MAKVGEEHPFAIWADLGGEDAANYLRQTMTGTALQIQQVQVENGALVRNIEDHFVLRQEYGPDFIMRCVCKTGFFAAAKIFEYQIELLLVLPGIDQEFPVC